MAYTYQSAVDLARKPLNDSAKTRYTDAVLFGYAISYTQKIARERPDLFFSSFATLPGSTAVIGDTWPLPESFLQVCADYITARAEFHDDEHVNTGRASQAFQLADGEKS